ncbi:MAG: hypothetical protein EOP05_15570, partial [Proteobacteria bacterium]
MKSSILVLAFAALMTSGSFGCAPHSRGAAEGSTDLFTQPPAPTLGQPAPLGGVDSSGGNIAEAGKQTVNESIEIALKNMRAFYWRMSFGVSFTVSEEDPSNVTGTIPMRYEIGSGSRTSVGFVADAPFFQAILPRNRDSVQATLRTLKVKFAPECSSKDGHKDASIDLKSAMICVSEDRLAKLPRGSVEKTLTALLVHEAAHSLGLEEDDAVTLQEFAVGEEMLADRYSEGFDSLTSATSESLDYVDRIATTLETAKSRAEVLKACELKGENDFTLSGYVSDPYLRRPIADYNQRLKWDYSKRVIGESVKLEKYKAADALIRNGKSDGADGTIPSVKNRMLGFDEACATLKKSKRKSALDQKALQAISIYAKGFRMVEQEMKVAFDDMEFIFFGNEKDDRAETVNLFSRRR